MKMKKILALMLASMMLLTACSSSTDDSSSSDSSDSSDASETSETEEADSSDPYAEHVDFSLSFIYMDEATDYTDEDLYRWVSDTFNADIDVTYIANSEHAETIRTWIYGDTLPDSAIWDSFNMVEYMDYIDQGLIRALPDGWEEDYPNLYEMYVKTGTYENLKVDGKTYAIPHAIYCNFVDMEAPIPIPHTLYYRTDWAEELGFDFVGKDAVTISEFKEYLEACVENDMAGNGTIGLTTSSGYIVSEFLNMVEGVNVGFNSFVRDEEAQEYVWTPEAEAEEVADGLSMIRDWYQEGLIDPDFYNIETAEAQTKFASNMAAACFTGGHVHGILGVQSTFESANSGLAYDDCVDVITLTNDDGSVYFLEQCNYYTHTIFSPNTDEETMARILSIMDFFCTKEGQYYMYCGVKGQDWDYDENGEVTSGVEYPSSMMWCFMSIVSDDFSFGNPVYSKEVRDTSLGLIEYLKENGEALEYNYEYNFYSSEAKNNYSVDLTSKMVELIMSDEDILSSWTEYLSQYDSMVDPLLEELNDTYY